METRTQLRRPATRAVQETGRGGVLVVVPTYNERENLEPLVTRVRTAVPAASLLVVDDNSPDGTGELALRLASRDDAVHVLRRARKDGLGTAYLAGFGWAMDNGYDAVVEMDADGSHHPEELPRLLGALAEADLVIGSRWVPGGKTLNWPRSRQLLSRAGNAYARLLLGLPVRDATSGYRAYRVTALRLIDLAGVTSHGYCFQIDLALRAVRAGLKVAEVPITFTDRARGSSKMNGAIVWEALWQVTKWRLAGGPRTSQ